MKTRYIRIAAACCAALGSGATFARAGALVVQSGQSVEMPGGSYQFDSLTIESGGSLLFDDSVRLNISGNVLLHGQLTVTPVFGGATTPTSGAAGAPGANGENGNPATIGASGTPGGPGGNGGAGVSGLIAVHQTGGIF